jgi:RecA-family ATPase
MQINNNDEVKIKQAIPVLHLNDAFKAKLEPRDFVLPSLPRGKVGLLAAAGGTGKSFWTLQACVQIASSGCCNFDLSGAEMDGGAEKIGSALLVSLEDESEDLTRRLISIKEHWQPDQERTDWIESIAEERLFQMLPLSGLGLSLFDDSCNPTVIVDQVREHAQTMLNLRLIVVDTLRRSHDGDENNNGHMSKVLRMFEQLAKDLNASVLLIHHENKAAMGNSDAGAGALRGASAIVDNARWVMRMQTMTQADAESRGLSDDERKFWIRVTNEKTNYGPIQREKWLQRVGDGVLVKNDPPLIVKGDNF